MWEGCTLDMQSDTVRVDYHVVLFRHLYPAHAHRLHIEKSTLYLRSLGRSVVGVKKFRIMEETRVKVCALFLRKGRCD